jgi:pSer/pThr/pTyr-binding forkhead associated (FHA) protein
VAGSDRRRQSVLFGVGARYQGAFQIDLAFFLSFFFFLPSFLCFLYFGFVSSVSQDSLNGTYVNNERVKNGQRRILQSGDHVDLLINPKNMRM